jgi:hypothetical protein
VRKIDLPAAQRGVVLMVSLIILVALTLGGLALVRSVGTTNIIAGNLAFQQSATHASQGGIEDGINNFLEVNDLSFFQVDSFTQGYAASAPAATEPATAAAWDTFWRTIIDPPGQVAATVAVKTCSPACANRCRRQYRVLHHPAPVPDPGRSIASTHRLCQRCAEKHPDRRQPCRRSRHAAHDYPVLLPHHDPHRRAAQYRELRPDHCRQIIPIRIVVANRCRSQP